jgi:hypothetical protein
LELCNKHADWLQQYDLYHNIVNTGTGSDDILNSLFLLFLLQCTTAFKVELELVLPIKASLQPSVLLSAPPLPLDDCGSR